VIAVVDYGASNVQSVLRALRAVGAEAVLSADPAVVRQAARVVVPGVGVARGPSGDTARCLRPTRAVGSTAS